MEEILISAALVAVGLVLLCFGGGWLVSGGEMIAKRFRISSFVIGMTIVAYGTSTPELAASIVAAGEHSGIILGNVIGSNIANIGMVIGISSILMPLAVKGYVLRKEIPIMMGASALLVVLSIDGSIAWYDGLVLLGGLGTITYRTFVLIKKQRSEPETKHGDNLEDTSGEDDDRSDGGDGSDDGNRSGAATATTTTTTTDAHKSQRTGNGAPAGILTETAGARFYTKNIIMMAAGVGFLYVGAILTVDHAVILAKTFGLSEKIIGLTVVAIGTSLPELITSIVAIRKGQQDIGVGNIVGSNIYNILMIMGVGAVLGGVAISADVYVDYAIMIGFSAALLVALKTNIISRRIGACLAAGYVVYLVMSLLK